MKIRKIWNLRSITLGIAILAFAPISASAIGVDLGLGLRDSGYDSGYIYDPVYNSDSYLSDESNSEASYSDDC